MKNKVIYIGIIAVIGLFQSCKNKEEQPITTDLISNTASASGAVDKSKMPVMEFEKEVHDFGTIIEGEKVAYSFKFKNTGESSLIISSATGSCGCTVPEYPKKPIAPGESGVIDVIFNSDGKGGKVDKKVTVVTNTDPASHFLTIEGTVIKPENKEKSNILTNE